MAAGALALLREAGIDLSRVIEAEAGHRVRRHLRRSAGGECDRCWVGAPTLPPARRASRGRAARAGHDIGVADGGAGGGVRGADPPCAGHRRRRIVLNLAPAAPLDPDALRARSTCWLSNETEAVWLAGQLGSEPNAASLHRTLGITIVRTFGEQGAEAASPTDPLACPGVDRRY